MTGSKPPARPASYDKKVALVLQGGGALGSYQAGVYEALASSEYLPDWVAGISIGAINAAIIAGNAPENRVARLRSFWEEITAPTAWWPSGLNGPLAVCQQKASALSALMFGQPGFFAPCALQDWFLPEKPTSYYSTNALKGTLERLVDFDRINNPREMRFSVGAVNVRTGRFAYFDSEEITIRPEHVMASGALPPGFPPIEIDGEHCWDGGLVSNTPLQSCWTIIRAAVVYAFRSTCSRVAATSRKISKRSASGTKISVFPAGRGSIPTPSGKSMRCVMRSTNCTNCCRRKSQGPNRPSGSMHSAASPRWTSSSSSFARTNLKARRRTMSSAEAR